MVLYKLKSNNFINIYFVPRPNSKLPNKQNRFNQLIYQLTCPIPTSSYKLIILKTKPTSYWLKSNRFFLSFRSRKVVLLICVKLLSVKSVHIILWHFKNSMNNASRVPLVYAETGLDLIFLNNV